MADLLNEVFVRLEQKIEQAEPIEHVEDSDPMFFRSAISFANFFHNKEILVDRLMDIYKSAHNKVHFTNDEDEYRSV